MANSEYQAGTCNIGGQERRQRRLLGYASLLVAVGWIAGVIAGGLPARYVLGVFIFLYGGVLGVLQSRRRFCVAYGMTGRYGFDDGEGEVEDDAARSRDRKRALLLATQALVAAIGGTSLAYGLVVSV